MIATLYFLYLLQKLLLPKSKLCEKIILNRCHFFFLWYFEVWVKIVYIAIQNIKQSYLFDNTHINFKSFIEWTSFCPFFFVLIVCTIINVMYVAFSLQLFLCIHLLKQAILNWSFFGSSHLGNFQIIILTNNYSTNT